MILYTQNNHKYFLLSRNINSNIGHFSGFPIYKRVRAIRHRTQRTVITGIPKTLQHMVVWMLYYNSGNYDLPNTTEEWESNFNEDNFNDFEDDKMAVIYEVKEEETASRNKKDENTTRM